MRQLSPREIRLTSPRFLTPRMAAKVASASSATLLSPIPPRTGSKSSSSLLKSGLSTPNHTPEPVNSAPASEQTVQSGSPRPVWPSVPFRLGEPLKPSSPVDGYFPNTGTRAVSNETAEGMRVETPINQGSSEWKPRRPTRPPSPKLEHAGTLSHSLSPELVDHLRSPTQNSPTSPHEDQSGRRSSRRRTNSIGKKGLRHQISSKGLNNLWRKDEKDRPEMPLRAATETVGLFQGALDPRKSSFNSMRTESTPSKAALNSSDTSEFGGIIPSSTSSPTSASLPSRSPHNGFASRILQGSFSFSRKTSDTSHSKRTPSISSPVANSFHRIISETAGAGAAQQPPSPTSPNSPRSVKRKPVPGLSGMKPESDSMKGFVLENPPKKSLPMGVAV